MMNPEQAIAAVTDNLDRSHRERRQSAAEACQRLDDAVNNARALNRDMAAHVFEAYQAEIARLREVNAQMLAALQAITDLCKREPANPFLADNMDRLAIAAITTATTGETS